MQLIDGNNFIAHHVKNNIPCAVGKIGVVELKMIYSYFNKNYHLFDDIIKEATCNAGIYPYTDENFNKFMEIYIESLKSLNAMPIWNKILSNIEIQIHQQINAYNIRLIDIEPYLHKNPWSHQLKDKDVIVISPFADSIKIQYKQKDNIWPNNILPCFNLKTIKYPHANTIDINSRFKNTLEVIEWTKEQISNIKYDVVIVGAGAASIPLISYIKKHNKIGIHMGGPTQILFGIKGKRWDNIEQFKNFFNDYWIRPSSDEIPDNKNLIEDGCYW